MRSTEERLPLRDAADALGISEVTARRWVKSGKLKAYQPGRKYLIPASAIEELLEANSPEDPQQWERTLASVRERQEDIETRVGEWVGLHDRSGVDPYKVKQALDEARDFEHTLILALPGSYSPEPNKVTVDLFAIEPGQLEEIGSAKRFYQHVIEQLVEAGLVKLKEGVGQKAEPIPVGIGA